MLPIPGMSLNGLSSEKPLSDIRFGRSVKPGASRFQNLRGKMLWLGLLAAPLAPALMPSTAHAADRVEISVTQKTASSLDWDDLRKQRRHGFRSVDAAVRSDIQKAEAEYPVKPGDTLYDVAEAVKQHWGAEFEKCSINKLVAVLQTQNNVKDPLTLKPGTRIDLNALREHFTLGVTAPKPAPPVTEPPAIAPAPQELKPPAPIDEIAPPVPADEVQPSVPDHAPPPALDPPADEETLPPIPVEEPPSIPAPPVGEEAPPPGQGGTVTPLPDTGTQIEQTAPKPDSTKQQSPVKNRGVFYGALLAIGGLLSTLVALIVRGLRGKDKTEKKPEKPPETPPKTGDTPPESSSSEGKPE